MTTKKIIVTEDGASTFLSKAVVVDSSGDPIAITTDGEVWTTETEKESGVWAGFSGSQDTATTTYLGAIDLSDTVNFPHDHTGRLDFSLFRISMDKAINARGTISIGIITRINGTNADITYLDGIGFLQNDSPSVQFINNLAPMQNKASMTGGVLDKVKTNTIELNVAAVNTGVTLEPFDFTPAVGDCVVKITTTTGGTLNYGIGLGYHSHP